PSFRPWPGSARDRELDEEWEREYLADENDGSDVEEELLEVRLDAQRDFLPREAVTFARSVSAERWRRYGVSPALIVASEGGEYRVIGLGTVDGGTRRRAWRGVRTVDYWVTRVLRE